MLLSETPTGYDIMDIGNGNMLLRGNPYGVWMNGRGKMGIAIERQPLTGYYPVGVDVQ